MNRIILIIAGLFEVAFAFCLGKAKATSGVEMYLWYGGFVLTLSTSMGLLIKATITCQIFQRIKHLSIKGAFCTEMIG